MTVTDFEPTVCFQRLAQVLISVQYTKTLAIDQKA